MITEANLKRIDRICDYTPGISTATNLVELFLKYTIAPCASRSNQFFTHIQDKSAARCLTLLIPIIGNIIVFCLDRQASFPKEENQPNEVDDKNDQVTKQSTVSDEERTRALDRLRSPWNIYNNGCPLLGMSNPLRNDKEVIMTALDRTGLALRYASDRLKNDPEVVKKAADKTPSSFQFASKPLQSSIRFITSLKGECLEYASPKIKANKSKILHIIEATSSITYLKYIDESLRDDFDVVLAAVKKAKGPELQYTSKRLQDNDEIATAAIQRNAANLKYLSDRLKDNENLVKQAVFQNPDTFKHLSERLKKNTEVFKLAALKDGFVALCDADETIKNDKECVLHAMKQNPLALMHASEEVKKDEELRNIYSVWNNTGRNLLQEEDPYAVVEIT